MIWTLCPTCGWKGWRDKKDPATCHADPMSEEE